MRPTRDQITAVVQAWAAIPRYPSEPAARRRIAEILAAMVGTVEGLRWLQEKAEGWEAWNGPAALRRLYVSRFPPMDGIEGAVENYEGGALAAAPERGMLT